MIPTAICGREDWTIVMPEWRAAREQTPWWEWPRYHSMFHNLRSGDVLYDVGAESGDQSALYSKWCGGQIILVEPNPVSWPAIRAIWEANNLPMPLATFQGFLSEENTIVPDAATGWPFCADGLIEPENGWCNLATDPDTPRVSLDRWCPYEPDAITIDVEGAELAVLKGAQETLTRCKPLVWVSIHPRFLWDFYELTRADVVGFMASIGYECEHLADEHEMHTLFWHPEGRTPVLPYR